MPASSPTPSYSLRDLGTLAGDHEASAAGLNNRGQVVGVSGQVLRGRRQRAFVWDARRGMRPLRVGHRSSRAVAINDLGEILGEYDALSPGVGGPADPHAFLWSEVGWRDLGDWTPVALNNLGQAVGTDRRGHAVLWERGRLADLGTLGDRVTRPTAINDAGVVVGYAVPAGKDLGAIFSHYRAWRWQRGRMEPIRDPDGVSSWAIHVTSTGLVLGGTVTGPDELTFCRWDLAGDREEFGPTGQFIAARANDAAVVIADRMPIDFPGPTLLIWGRHMVPLVACVPRGELGDHWIVRGAGINLRGEIAADAWIGHEVGRYWSRAVLLRPR